MELLKEEIIPKTERLESEINELKEEIKGLKSRITKLESIKFKKS